MGLLYKVFKAEVQRLLDKAESQAAQKLDETLSSYKKDSSSFSGCEKSVSKKLEECFSKHFSSYTYKKDVRLAELGGDKHGERLAYVLYLDGTEAAVIMVMGHNGERSAEYRISKRFIEDKGIPFITFYKQFPNNEDYIYERLRKILKFSV